jgi:hypothetical protein
MSWAASKAVGACLGSCDAERETGMHFGAVPACEGHHGAGNCAFSHCIDDGYNDVIQNGSFQLLKAGHRHIIFKMSDVSYIDSCGLGQLVSVYRSIKNMGGSMCLH